MFIPEDVRNFPSQRNPHCKSEMWRPQIDLEEEDQMRDPNWYPRDTRYNIYNKKDFKREAVYKSLKENNDQI
jgi:hypothetical protein